VQRPFGLNFFDRQIFWQTKMTGEQSRPLKADDRVRWGDTTADLGAVIGTTWSEVTIWDDAETNSVSHNDMAKVEQLLNKLV
jgi:hypothetical protein